MFLSKKFAQSIFLAVVVFLTTDQDFSDENQRAGDFYWSFFSVAFQFCVFVDYSVYDSEPRLVSRTLPFYS